MGSGPSRRHTVRQPAAPVLADRPRYVEEQMLPACQRHGLGAVIYSPLGGGILTGKYKRGEEPPADVVSHEAGYGGGCSTRRASRPPTR